jgi:hypothetical protein
MSGLIPVTIGGYPDGGLITDRKPLMLPDQAYSNLQNAYVYRGRTIKRLGQVLVGRLQRSILVAGHSLTGGSINLITAFSLEASASIVPGSISITGGTDGTTYTDPSGNGILTATGGTGTGGTINYASGELTIIAGGGETLTGQFLYYPNLPVMGILKNDVATLDIDQAIFFNTKYAFIYTGGAFEQLGTAVWTGSNTNFFWASNYQGANPSIRNFYVTNNNITLGMATPYDPIRYFDGAIWHDLQPIIADDPPSPEQFLLYQTLIIIPYYGRLVALNTWEGTTVDGPAAAVNFFARCRFSEIGDPTSLNAWRSDMFGLGGFLDAPTNEAIVSAAFFRNTLIVFFEQSTWQLRYIGEYGLPFIFERISSDFGSASTYSPIIFDEGVMTISNRGAIQAGSNGLIRLDKQIPETIFTFAIQNLAPNFVHGIRDFEKELVYWNYIDDSSITTFQNYPNTVLLYNYENKTWAQFRDTITCFGLAQFQFGITWDSTDVFWDDADVTWDNADGKNYTTYVTAGNQQGFVFIYENQNASTTFPALTIFAPSLYIAAIANTATVTQFTVPSHNLANGEIIYITDTQWSGTNPGINNIIYNVTVVDANTISLGRWNGSNYDAQLFTLASTYLGGGYIALFPKMNIVGKDFNPFQGKGKQFKLSYIDFQMDQNQNIPLLPAVTIQLFINAYIGTQANMFVGNTNQELLNSCLLTGFITNATRSDPCQITSIDHSLLSGTLIYISNIQGMTQLNSNQYTITVVDANTFTINIDSSGFSPFTIGTTGIWNAMPTDGQLYQSGSQYAWYRFYSTQFGQYLRVAITYDDTLMNQLSTHQSDMELNAMNFWFREGGRLMN